MSKRLEDVLERRRRINSALYKLIACHDEIYWLKPLTRVISLAAMSQDLPEKVPSIATVSDILDNRLRDLEAEIKLVGGLFR